MITPARLAEAPELEDVAFAWTQCDLGTDKPGATIGIMSGKQ